MSSLPSKDYASKTRKVLCGYCSKEWREANLEAHCKNVHGKPKLIKGEQNILKTNYFARTTKKGVDTTILMTPMKKLIVLQIPYTFFL